ncbi:MAG TPA: GGDEF domain-containing protein [Candidatus Latescibacteria bacterium]|nr:GGDEF domain-containing protein [Candidatus Handelsmanbacteria bacterium]HIL10212.1 GGDEF domain-containing protein [Candidatus Latescibacterota bacterium]
MSGSEDLERLQAEVDRLERENEKLRARNRRWMRIAGTDGLTGLPNKIFFSTALLPQIISSANADGQGFVCVMIAPDKLGDINEKYGREGGDQIVNELSKYLKENVEADEKLVHIDGANFVVIVPKGDQAQAKRRTRQIRAQVVSRHFECHGDAVTLTLSMGVTIQPAEPQGAGTKVKEVAEDLLKRMGVALDQAKKQGGDKIVEDFEADEA